jgi:UrcA family protein
MVKNYNWTIATLVTIIWLAVISGPVGATEPQAKATGCAGSDIAQVKVCYRDLNLSHQEGVTALYRRINNAAKQVCGRRPVIMDVKGSALYDECRRDVVARAVNDVGHPGLAALHQRTTNGTGSPVLAVTSIDKNKK